MIDEIMAEMMIDGTIEEVGIMDEMIGEMIGEVGIVIDEGQGLDLMIGGGIDLEVLRIEEGIRKGVERSLCRRSKKK